MAGNKQAANRLSGKSVAGTFSASASLPDSVRTRIESSASLAPFKEEKEEEEEKMQEDAKDDFILSAASEENK